MAKASNYENAITEPLRRAIKQAISAGQTFLSLEKATGVKRQSLMKFVRCEQSLRLDVADRLATHFGLSLKN